MDSNLDRFRFFFQIRLVAPVFKDLSGASSVNGLSQRID